MKLELFHFWENFRKGTFRNEVALIYSNIIYMFRESCYKIFLYAAISRCNFTFKDLCIDAVQTYFSSRESFDRCARTSVYFLKMFRVWKLYDIIGTSAHFHLWLCTGPGPSYITFHLISTLLIDMKFRYWIWNHWEYTGILNLISVKENWFL
jgi:hypothetical protein